MYTKRPYDRLGVHHETAVRKIQLTAQLLAQEADSLLLEVHERALPEPRKHSVRWSRSGQCPAEAQKLHGKVK